MRGLALALMLVAGAAQAADWPMPGQAELTADEAGQGLRLATGAWTGTALPLRRAEGAARHRAWRITGDGGLRPVDLVELARRQLVAQGYEILYECDAPDCGGFDFRFALPLVAEPAMHVDLGRYRYLAAVRDGQAVAIWGSRGPEAGFVQVSEGDGPLTDLGLLPGGVPLAPAALTAPEGAQQAASDAAAPPAPSSAEAGPEPTAAPPAPSATDAATAPTPASGADAGAAPTAAPISPSTSSSAAEADAQSTAAPAREPPPAPTEPGLFPNGALVLDGIDFPPGSRDLANPEAPILARLAAWLTENPARRLVLVGHSDGAGGLAGNIAVSKARADSVRRALIEAHGADPARITAEGAGWLAPRAPETTEAGRAANRRVEAIPRE